MAQSPGIIVRPAAGIGVTPLNPNGDGFSSSTTSGFVNSDITESEIPTEPEVHVHALTALSDFFFEAFFLTFKYKRKHDHA